MYGAAEASVKEGRGLAGVLFWRWAAVENEGGGDSLGSFDKATMIDSSSPVFTDIIAPFSAKLAAERKRVVKGCVKDARPLPAATKKAGAAPAAVAAASATAPPALVAAGGRRLAQMWADVSDVSVADLGASLPGGYRPAGLSGPWAGATNAQLKMSWNPHFVTAAANASQAPAVAAPPPAVGKSSAKAPPAAA